MFGLSVADTRLVYSVTRYYKFPKILHLPWSQHVTTDDRVMGDVSYFAGKEIVVTCKLDGENTNIYRDHMHARAVDSKDHVSRHWIKNLVSSFQHEIPEGWRFCGENLYALHSIRYNELPSYFFLFGIFDEKNVYLSWGEVKEYAGMLHLETVPVLYRGMWDEVKVRECFTGKSVFGESEQEGYVVRVARSFSFDDFDKNIAKMVRKNHVQTEDNWMTQPVVPNKLKEK